MPNGKPGDHPVTDLLVHGWHPFPEDIEALIREIHALETLDARKELWASIYERAWDWQQRGLSKTHQSPKDSVLNEGRQWLQVQVRRLKESD